MADLQPREPILEPIIARKSLAMLYGPRGLGKTFVALGIAWAAAAGESFLKWRASRPHRVLYVDGEMAAVDMKARLQLLGSAPPTLDFLIADLNRDPPCPTSATRMARSRSGKAGASVRNFWCSTTSRAWSASGATIPVAGTPCSAG